MARCRACATYLTDNMIACPQCGLPRVIGSYEHIPTARQVPFGTNTVPNPAAARKRASTSKPVEGFGSAYPFAGEDNSTKHSSDMPESFDPAIVYSTPEERRVLPVSEYLRSLLLMMIPFAGIVFQLVWGYRDTDNYNRRNLAKAYLWISIVLHIVGIIAFFVLRRMLSAG